MGCILSKSNKIYVKDYENNVYDFNYWRSNDECCICLDNKCNILFLPCKHIVVCDICASMLQSQRVCPVCQSDIYSYNLLQIISVIPAK